MRQFMSKEGCKQCCKQGREQGHGQENAHPSTSTTVPSCKACIEYSLSPRTSGWGSSTPQLPGAPCYELRRITSSVLRSAA